MASSSAWGSADGVAVDTSLPSASGSSSANRSTQPSKKMSTHSSDTCTCTSDGESLSKRQCYACLNTLLLSRETCAINPYGACVTEVEAERVQSSLQSSPQQYVPGSLAIYSSTNTTYCEPTDQVCSACRAKWVSDYASGSLGQAMVLGQGNGTALSCIGANGCVCLAYCELALQYTETQFEGTTYSTSCPTPTPSSVVNYYAHQSKVGGLDFVIYAFITGLVAVGLMLITRVISNRCKPIDPSRIQSTEWPMRRRRQPPLVRSEPRMGPLLTFAGWAAFRERLIADEREKLNDEGESVQSPTPILSGAAPRVVVDVGEGFRPESPNQMTRQQPPEQV